MIVRTVKKCRICGNSELVPVVDLGTMAFTGIFPQKEERSVPEGPLELVKCHGDPARTCGLLQLGHSFDPKVLFGGRYGYRSGLNGSMRLHLQDISRRARSFVALGPGDAVMDVGSNDGTMLNFFSGEGLFLLGVDPAAGQFGRHYARDVRVVPDFFSGDLVKKSLGPKKAKIITAVAVFYTLDAPRKFLEEVRDVLDDGGICVLEQSYLPLMLDHLAYDAVCHEHVAYYRLKQIKWLAEQAGLRIIHGEGNPVNGGSFCVVLAKKDSGFTEDLGAIGKLAAREDRMSLEDLSPYEGFRERVFRHREDLCRVVRSLRDGGRRILGYGASTKGNVLLQFCGFTEEDIPFVADINEDKWGRVCPGTRIPIISEEEAKGLKPDLFFVLPWHFREWFLKKEEKYLKAGGKFLFPLPEIGII